jgi:hypothetical protein
LSVINFRSGGSADRRKFFLYSAAVCRRAATNKKTLSHDEKGRQNFYALLIFPKPMMLELELAPDIETKVQPVAVVSLGQSLDHSS